MIATLAGRLRRRLEDRVVLDCGGVGYEVCLPPLVQRQVEPLPLDSELTLSDRLEHAAVLVSLPEAIREASERHPEVRAAVRQREAAEFRALGTQRAQEIRSRADRDVTILVARLVGASGELEPPVPATRVPESELSAAMRVVSEIGSRLRPAFRNANPSDVAIASAFAIAAKPVSAEARDEDRKR